MPGPVGQVYLTALLVGLMGGVHCVAMCGGIVSAFSLGMPTEVRRDGSRMLLYQVVCNLGRVIGYTLIGAVFGGLGAIALGAGPFRTMQLTLYVVAGSMMVLLGLHLGGWWQRLAVLERMGLVLWRRLQPTWRHLLPIDSIHRAGLAGLVWSLLPCGLVYSVLISAAATGSPISGAGVMLVFGVGTLPNLIGAGLLAGAAARIAERNWIRQGAGVVVIAFGLQALWQVGADAWS